MDPDALIRWLDLTGVLFNAILGGVVARAHRLDPIGFAVLAILSGLGGGMIRDTLLQAGPPVALTDNAYVLTALAGAVIAFAVRLEGRIWDRAFPPIDALALGLWAAVGAQKALAVGLGPLAAVMLGVVTAVGGGFVRDVVMRQVPRILGRSTLYATCALAAAVLATAVTLLGASTVGGLAGAGLGAVLCLLAQWRGWVLPEAIGWKPPRPSFRRWRSLAGRAVRRRRR
ncbi:TRIC cation channel family protein [Ruania suaedae]|uniref:trimeric intracellular cation channel family protein n=1 Tax=Ruania suaedae TaxID=2897774 RepID=UPI001E2D4A91|nr:TRIC cation channel family protein [Ruania suaedae]UFU03700.1 TRIC cation channel family protein [Ruania suaedae]